MNLTSVSLALAPEFTARVFSPFDVSDLTIVRLEDVSADNLAEGLGVIPYRVAQAKLFAKTYTAAEIGGQNLARALCSAGVLVTSPGVVIYDEAAKAWQNTITFESIGD